jgi:hypothetical protein
VALIYANENFPQPAVEELRRLGHDVLTVLEAGKSGMAEPDVVVLAYARLNSRALLTLNRKHFVRLHNDCPEHEGIVVCSFDPDFAGQARRIHAAIEAEGTLQNKLIRVNRP